jgi:DNA-directed RNA polymerase specialized sigma24 family protein
MLQGLLRLLHEDKYQAANEYRQLHERLTRFFEWNDVDDPESLAGEELDRLGRRATEAGMDGGVRNAAAFALGVARHILQEEARRRHQMEELARHLKTRESTSTAVSEFDALQDALQHCLAQMSADRRQLIEAYYTYDTSEKAKVHQKLAASYGLSVNALRNRALRARQDLEACMRRRLRKNIS